MLGGAKGRTAEQQTWPQALAVPACAVRGWQRSRLRPTCFGTWALCNRPLYLCCYSIELLLRALHGALPGCQRAATGSSPCIKHARRTAKLPTFTGVFGPTCYEQPTCRRPARTRRPPPRRPRPPSKPPASPRPNRRPPPPLGGLPVRASPPARLPGGPRRRRSRPRPPARGRPARPARAAARAGARGRWRARACAPAQRPARAGPPATRRSPLRGRRNARVRVASAAGGVAHAYQYA